MSNSKTLNNFCPDDFLTNYWQKRPLLVRQALPNITCALDPEDLAGLACEPDIEARIILEKDGTSPWELRHGPFAEQDFTQLPASHWTLLVQDVDKFVPEIAQLLEYFPFIPRWRVDDIMLSYAVPHGSVGPHLDAYDVFLIQLQGHRRWQISDQYDHQSSILNDTPLRILQSFEPQQEWTLAPGDFLYLPPGIAHFGSALDDCITASVGFRAPNQRELLSAFLEYAIEDADDQRRYTDAGLSLPTNPGEISAQALTTFANMLPDGLTIQPATLARWLGRLITEPKPNFQLDEPSPLTPRACLQALKAGQPLRTNPMVRFAFTHSGPRQIHFCADGQCYELSGNRAALGQLIANQSTLDARSLQPFIQEASTLQWLCDLYNLGYFEPL